MGLLFRGIVWFGLYLVLVLLPLVAALLGDPLPQARDIAVETGVACGFIAFALLVLEFALVSRLRAASEPFGTDALMQFHRLMGLGALAFLLAHPLLLVGHGASVASFDPLTTDWRQGTGALAFWLLPVLVVTSVWRKRLRLRYERWRRLHSGAALVIVVAALIHVLTRGHYARGWWLAGLLLFYGGLVLALMLRYRVLRPLWLWSRAWRVVANRDEGGSTRVLTLKPTGRAGIAFQPGQFAWLITGRTPFSAQQHPLSIASSAERAHDGVLEFAVKALGDWSRTVPPALAPGTRVWVDGPYGAFTPDREPGQGFVLIAGGIGVAPMRSILLTLRDREDARPALLFFAARNWQRVTFRGELAALERTMNLKVVYVFEEVPPGWNGERGHVTADVLRRHLPRQYRRFQFFVCGPPPMMASLEAVLGALAVPAANIHTERFDMV